MKSGYAVIVASMLVGAPAFAEVSTQSIIDDLNAKGFDRIEIERGPTQVKVEASNGSQQLEVIYDRANGQIMKQEMERLRVGEDKGRGTTVRDRNADFMDDDEDRRDRRSRSSDDDDDDYKDRSGRDSDDDDDDHDKSGRGSDDSSDDSDSDDSDDDDSSDDSDDDSDDDSSDDSDDDPDDDSDDD